jgi:hypothetical protein
MRAGHAYAMVRFLSPDTRDSDCTARPAAHIVTVAHGKILYHLPVLSSRAVLLSHCSHSARQGVFFRLPSFPSSCREMRQTCEDGTVINSVKE